MTQITTYVASTGNNTYGTYVGGQTGSAIYGDFWIDPNTGYAYPYPSTYVQQGYNGIPVEAAPMTDEQWLRRRVKEICNLVKKDMA